MVGVRHEPGVHLHLARQHRLQLIRHVVPRRDLLGPGGELGVGRDHAERLLPLEDLRPQRIPPGVEAAPVAVDPVVRCLVRRVGRAGREVHEERLVGQQRLLLAHPGDGVVGHVLREVVALLGAAPRFHRRRALIDRRVPLVGLAADEAVEVLEAPTARGPRVERPHRARLVHRHLMALAELRRRIAVQLERLGQRCRRVGPDAGVARSRRGELGDATHPHRVVVAARQQRLTRRRTQRRGVEPVVAQTARRQTLRGRRLDRAAERARRRETGVVDEDHQHIRSSRRRPRLTDRWKRRRRILRVIGRPNPDTADGHRESEELPGSDCCCSRSIASTSLGPSEPTHIGIAVPASQHCRVNGDWVALLESTSTMREISSL